jgi:hypothetical protein
LYLQCRFYDRSTGCEARKAECDCESHSPVDCKRMDKEMWYLIKVLELNRLSLENQIDFFTAILIKKIRNER